MMRATERKVGPRDLAAFHLKEARGWKAQEKEDRDSGGWSLAAYSAKRGAHHLKIALAYKAQALGVKL